jgi:hypothetical protein
MASPQHGAHAQQCLKDWLTPDMGGSGEGRHSPVFKVAQSWWSTVRSGGPPARSCTIGATSRTRRNTKRERGNANALGDVVVRRWGGRSAAPRASPGCSGSLGPVHRDGGAVKQDTTADRGDQNRGRCGDAYQSGQWGGGGSVMCHMGSSYRCVVQGAK